MAALNITTLELKGLAARPAQKRTSFGSFKTPHLLVSCCDPQVLRCEGQQQIPIYHFFTIYYFKTPLKVHLIGNSLLNTGRQKQGSVDKA